MDHKSSSRASRSRREWAGLGGLFALLAAAMALYIRAERTVIERAESARLDHQANVVEKNLVPRIQATWSVLEVLRAEVPALRARPDGMQVLNERMVTMVNAMTGVRSLALVDAQGRIEASNRTALVGTDVSGGERYQEIRSRPEKEKLYSRLRSSRHLGTWR